MRKQHFLYGFIFAFAITLFAYPVWGEVMVTEVASSSEGELLGKITHNEAVSSVHHST